MATTKKTVKATQASVWLQPDGPFTAAQAFEVGQVGMTDKTNPVGGRTAVYGRDQFGRPRLLNATRDLPGDLANFSIENYDGLGEDFFDRMAAEFQCRAIQERINECQGVDLPSAWVKIRHFGRSEVGDQVFGAGPNRDGSDPLLTKTSPITSNYIITLLDLALSKQTTTETEDLNGVVFISDPEDCNNCGRGYVGPDKIGYIAADAGAAATAHILYTQNGGGTWAATSADPFLADEHTDYPQWNWITKNQFRLVVGRAITDAGNPAEIAYADVTLGAEGTTVWTNVNVGSTNGDIIDFILWPHQPGFVNRLYAAFGGGDIGLSTDLGATFSTVYTGTDTINAMAVDPFGNVWAVGDNGLILRECNQSGTFDVMTAPAGAPNGTSIFIANDGTIWAGWGTALYYNDNSASTAARWISSKDFGANHAVVALHCPGGPTSNGGDSQLVYAVVNDSVTPDGDVWHTEDGGGFWQEVADLTNAGYNAAYFSSLNDNLGFIVGDDDGSTGIIHKLSPSNVC
jgi:hypothetical protein